MLAVLSVCDRCRWQRKLLAAIMMRLRIALAQPTCTDASALAAAGWDAAAALPSPNRPPFLRDPPSYRSSAIAARWGRPAPYAAEANPTRSSTNSTGRRSHILLRRAELRLSARPVCYDPSTTPALYELIRACERYARQQERSG